MLKKPDYFPLDPSLKLVYDMRDEGGQGTLTFEVLCASKKGRVTTAKCRQTVSGVSKPTEYEVIRKPRGIYSPWGKEFPLPLAPDLAWLRNEHQQCWVDALDATVTVSLCEFKDCLRIWWTIDEGEGGSGERCYAPGVGLIYANSSEDGDEFEMSLSEVYPAPKG